MRYASKQHLLESIRREHDTLCELLRSIPQSWYHEPGIWGDDWNIADLVAHLAEWHRLFLGWYNEGAKGRIPSLPAPGYKWNQTPALNRAIWSRNQARSLRAIRTDFEAGYRRIIRLVEDLPERVLLRPGYFAWTGHNPLVTYLGANSASHYRFAIKVLTRWRRRTSSFGQSGKRQRRSSPATREIDA